MDYIHPAEYGQMMGQWGMAIAPQQQQEVYNWTGAQQYGDKNQRYQDMWKGNTVDKWWQQDEEQPRSMGAKGHKNPMDGKVRQDTLDRYENPIQGVRREYHEQWKGKPDGKYDQQLEKRTDQTIQNYELSEENMWRQKGGK